MKKTVSVILIVFAFTMCSFAQEKSQLKTEAKNEATDKKAEDKKAADKKAADKKAEDKKAADKKAEDKKAADKKAEDKKAADKKAEDKNDEAQNNSPDENATTAPDQPSTQEIQPSHNETTISDDKAISEESSHFGLYIYLTISLLIAIIALFFSYTTRNTLLSEIKYLKQKLSSNTGNNDNWNLTPRIVTLEKEIKSFDGSIDEMRQEFTKKIKSLTVQTPVAPPIQNSAVANKASSSVKYTKYADMGDGFSVGELSNEQNDENIFEIVIVNNNTAKFRIVSNRNAQLFALSNAAYFLGKTCKYDTVPTSNAKITTETEGELKLQGNKWQIINPAKIIFS